MNGVLREEILPKSMRSSFQKAVAMVDEPDVALAHFSLLAAQIRKAAGKTAKTRLRAARQLYVCLWILYVWARDAGNVEAPHRASEIVLLNIWEILRPAIKSKTSENKAMTKVLDQALQLHLRIALGFLETTIFPHVGVRHGLSCTAHPQSGLDVNLALFSVLGRIGMAGLWLYYLSEKTSGVARTAAIEALTHVTARGFDLIDNNPTLLLPVSDDQAADITLFLMLAAASGAPADRVGGWLLGMIRRLNFTVRARSHYPIIFSDYRTLATTPRDRSDQAFEEATAGSTLIPILMAWGGVVVGSEATDMLAALAHDKLSHCTFQLWMPDVKSEEHLYLGDETHGRALTDIPIAEGLTPVLGIIKDACEADTGFVNLSTNKAGLWPLTLLACRRHHLPIPPHAWIGSLIAPTPPTPSPLGTEPSQMSECADT